MKQKECQAKCEESFSLKRKHYSITLKNNELSKIDMGVYENGSPN
jgi:hypothetical protein